MTISSMGPAVASTVTRMRRRPSGFLLALAALLLVCTEGAASSVVSVSLETFSVATGGSPQSIAISDLNRDGRLDLVSTSFSNDVSIMLGRAGGLSPAQSAPAGSGQTVVEVADFDGDLRP